MLPPKPIRQDISAESVRLAAKGLDDETTKRLSAIANILDGLPCKEAAAQAGCYDRSLNRWIDVFNDGGVARLIAVRRGRRRANDIHTGTTADEIRQRAEKLDETAKKRCLAIAAILDGESREDVASMAQRSLQTIRRWMRRYKEAGIEGLKIPKRQKQHSS